MKPPWALPKAPFLDYPNRLRPMNTDGLRFFNPFAEIRHTENRLPHWQQQGAVYFVTFRLADAVPLNLRTQLENERATWLRLHPQPWSAESEQEYHQRFTGAVERWLDAGHGACVCCGGKTAGRLSLARCNISIATAPPRSHGSLCRTTCT